MEKDKSERAPGHFSSLVAGKSSPLTSHIIIRFNLCRTCVCMDKRHSGSPSTRVWLTTHHHSAVKKYLYPPVLFIFVSFSSNKCSHRDILSQYIQLLNVFSGKAAHIYWALWGKWLPFFFLLHTSIWKKMQRRAFKNIYLRRSYWHILVWKLQRHFCRFETPENHKNIIHTLSKTTLASYLKIILIISPKTYGQIF